MLPPLSGYRRVYGILEQLIFKTHEVSLNLLKNSPKDSSMKYGAETLHKLSVKVANFHIEFEIMDCPEGLNFLVTLLSIQN